MLRMKTVIFIQVLYVLINFETRYNVVNGAEKCESNIETRAVLISCPEKDTGCDDDDPLSKATQADEYRLLQVKPSEMKKVKAEIEREFPSRVTECKRKLVITIKLNNKGKIECDDGFIVIDHVYDPITRGKARLLSPVIIKLRQEQMVQLYPLQFQKVVNSNPNENIFTKETCSLYKGCSVNLDNPTCGITTYNGEPIPFSEGFCCSCDPYVNAVREVIPDKHENAFRYKDPRLFGYEKNQVTRSRETRSVIINPHLLNLRASNRPRVRRVSSAEEEDAYPNLVDQQLQTPPNFFFERDRQIVCAPEALLKELCNLDGKDSDGKDDDEVNDDDSNSGGSEDVQFKRISNKNQENNSNNENDDCNENVNKNECNNQKDTEECNDNNNQNKNNGNNANTVNSSKENHNSVTDAPNGKNTPKESNHKVDKETLHSVHRYLVDEDTDGGGQYHFTGNNKIITMPLKNDNGNIKTIEIVNRKREIRNNIIPARHRKKRLTRDNDAYSLSYQYATDATRRWNKRFLSAADRKISNPKLYEKFNVETELCAESSSSPNCTLPIFFFSHDKNILCPPCIPQNKSGELGNPENTEYEDSNLNTGNENDNDSDSLEEIQELEQPPPSPPPPKMTRLHTNSGGTWDVNANIRRGNIFTLDLIKSEDKEDKPEQSEKIEQINYEQKNFLPVFRDDYLKSKVIQKFKSSADKERLRYRGEGTNMYGNENKLYGQDQKEKNIENLIDFASKNIKEQYNTQNVRKENAQYPYNEGNKPNFRSEMKIIVPNPQQNYRQINLDLRPKDLELLRKGSYTGSEHPGGESGYERGGRLGSRLENMYKTVVATENKNLQRSETCQNRKDVKIGENGVRYYEGTGENAWKKSYYPQSWGNNENGRPDFRHPPEASGREKIADLLAYNYPHNDETDSQYLVSSQNIFFADSKPHRNPRRKDMRGYEEHFYDENTDDTGRNRARQPGRDVEIGSFANGKSLTESEGDRFEGDPVFYEDGAKVSEAYFDRFPPVSKNFDEYNQRYRRRAALSPQMFYSDFDSGPYRNLRKLRNSQLVRKRERRSVGEAPVQEPTVKISKWEHRTPPGPEYQFDVSKLTRPRSERAHFYSSGTGDKHRMGDVQNNFAKLKTKPGNRDREWEEAETERKLKLDRKRLIQSYATSPSKFKRDIHNEMKGKRHIKNGRRQERGGQECSEKDSTSTTTTTTTTEKSTTTTTTTTAKTEQQGDASQESTHCMKLSDLWYSVYLIKRPELSQLVGVQIYDKQTMCDGTTNWRDVTKGYMVRLGSFLQKAEDDVPTISMTFTPTGPNIAKDEPKLDTENYRLLIPSHLTNEKKASFYPEFYGGPSEFMLVRNDDVSETGADCNKIGTSFEAFARQPGRCSKPPGSCLKRQPVDLWREDMEARIRGKRGKYFIENFGNVSNTSIKSYSNLTGDFLAMDYYGEYSSVLEIEMRADGNAVVRQGENAQIPMVYIDSISARKTKIVLSVINMGLTSALFRPRLGECPSNLDPTWCPLEGPLVQIPPQQRHDFKLELSGTLPAKKVHCAVEVLNHYNKKVARRRIIIRRNDRCFCAFYCKCVCVGGSKKSTCNQLTKEDYNAAGYFDPIPQKNEMSVSGTEAFLENLKVVAISMAYALFIFGLIKAILGLFWRRLGTAGVQVIVGPATLNQYYERNIRCYQVVYDECGFPIHPQTCKTVQIVPMWLEMFLNFFFFYLYLLKVIWLLISSIPCCKLMYTDLEVCCRADESDYETTDPKMDPSRNYSSNYFTYNVMTFTSKKAKPEENALYNPYKADEDPLEEDDIEFVLEEIKRYKHKNTDE